MRFCYVSMFASISLGLAPAQSGKAPSLAADAPVLGYKLVAEWPALATSAAGAPAAWNFLQVSGIAVDASGRILVLHRGAHPFLEFESNGKFVRSRDHVTFSEGKVAAIAPADHV